MEKNSVEVKKLLGLTIGELRERLAYADSDWFVEEWLEDYDGLDDVAEPEDYEEEVEDEDYEDEDYDCEEDCEEEEEDNWEEDDIELPSDQEELAEQVARDIYDKKYTLDTISCFYSEEFIARVNQLLD